MSLKNVQSAFSRKILSLYLSKQNFDFEIEKLIFRFSQPLLFLVGLSLLTGGILNLSHGQYDPERTQDQAPEGVCCVIPYPQQLITLGPEPIANVAFAEQTVTVGPEQTQVVGPEGTRTIAPEDAATIGPEDAATIGPEDAVTRDVEGTNVIEVETAVAQEAEPLDPNFDDRLIRFSTGNLLRFIEGAFGALVMVASGIGAIVAAAFGAYRAAIALLFVAVGAFILRALVSLFFGTNYPAYDAQFVGGGEI